MAYTHSPLIIGIAGGSGSGKTTLAQLILDHIGADKIAFLPHDAYYRDQDHLPYEERLKVNYDHPDSLETELLVRHIQELKAGRAIDLPVYDFNIYSRKHETRRIEPRSIILVAECEAQWVCTIRPTVERGWGLDAVWSEDFHHSARVAATGGAA